MNGFTDVDLYAPAAVLVKGQSIESTGFIASATAVVLNVPDSIVINAPGCLAAPKVSMCATNAIELGLAGQGCQQHPVRLYAPEGLSIQTRTLSIRDIMLIDEPKIGSVSCVKLVFHTSSEEESQTMEIVKSWVQEDTTVIETILLA